MCWRARYYFDHLRDSYKLIDVSAHVLPVSIGQAW
jgi:hypothetical protein